MSVYKRPGAETYSFDFQHKGRRFSGTLPATTRREAERLEQQERAKAKAEYAEHGAFRDGDMTVEVAVSRYWHEIGQHHRNAQTTWKSLGWIVRSVGPKTRFSSIDDRLVAELVARRRAEHKPTSRKRPSGSPPRLIKAATVNRTMTEVLRKVMLRARDVWKVKVGDVIWKNHLLEEPRERVREATFDEEAGIMSHLERGYDAAVAFAFASGCRRGEIVARSADEVEERYQGLLWSRVDFGNKQFTVIGKGGKSRVLPMTTALFDILWAQQGMHPTSVFTFEAARTRKHGGREMIKGRRYPILDAGLRTAMRRATTEAGVKDFRFHDTRHTMATRTLRGSNMKVVQTMLGHDRVTTTEKYAHAMVEDVRAAMEAATNTKNPTNAQADRAKIVKVMRNDG